MKFSIFTGMTGTTWDEILTLWRHADQTGWDAACVTDHFMPNTADRVGDTLECWTALAALADRTWVVGDLGCGTGQVAAALAPFVGRIVAVDGSAAMLQAAKKRLRDFDHVDLRRGDLESLPIDDGRLDLKNVTNAFGAGARARKFHR